VSLIQEHIREIRKTLPPHVNLLCVSKFQPIESIREAYLSGERDFGESHAQELVRKYEALPKDIRWHFIGHLQTNKIKLIVPFVHLIHSVDSLHLMQAIEKETAKQNRIVHILLELHVAKEESKTGFLPNELPTDFTQFPHLQIDGVMGMATLTDDEQEIRRCFSAIATAAHTLPVQEPVLSMGMSEDYPIAIEEGSNLVRIGSSIFGERNYNLPN